MNVLPNAASTALLRARCSCADLGDEDDHDRCIFCLGVGHALDGLAVAPACGPCGALSSESRSSRYLEVLQATAGPLPPSEEEEGDVMEDSAPTVVPVPASEGSYEGGPEQLEDMVSEAPFSASGGDAIASAPPSMREDFHHLMRAAAGRLSIPMPAPLPLPTPVAQMEMGPYAKPVRAPEPMLPAMPVLDRYLRGSWLAPANARVPVSSFSQFTRAIEGFEGQRKGLPPIEEALAQHLAPGSVGSWSSKKPQLPGTKDRFSAALYDKMYVLHMQCAAANSAIGTLSASISRLATGRNALEAAEVDEVARASAQIAHLTQAVASCEGRSVALVTVAMRHLWLSHATMETAERMALVNAPVSEAGLFGDALADVANRMRGREEQQRQLATIIPTPPATASGSSGQRGGRRPEKRRAPASTHRAFTSPPPSSATTGERQSRPRQQGGNREPAHLRQRGPGQRGPKARQPRFSEPRPKLKQD